MVDIISFLVNNYQLLLILPIVMALSSEKYYTGRISILTNTVSMFVSIAPYWERTKLWLRFGGFSLFHIYVKIGLIFGFISFFSYLFGESQEGDFYDFTWLFYNSVIAGLVCLFTSYFL
ncbi:MAG: hypothetical protein ACTSQY_09730 [Candidatus Odinarchaeia archaeon]